MAVQNLCCCRNGSRSLLLSLDGPEGEQLQSSSRTLPLIRKGTFQGVNIRHPPSPGPGTLLPGFVIPGIPSGIKSRSPGHPMHGTDVFEELKGHDC